MPLPGVNIELDNGALGGSVSTNDQIAGLILTGVTVAGTDKVTIGNAYNLTSLQGAVDLGIDSTGTNTYAYDHIKGFYDMAGTGKQIWIMLVASTVTMEDMLDNTLAYAPVLLNAAKGSIRKLGVSRKSASGVTVADGLDEDVDKAMIKGQQLADEFASNFKPFRFLVDGKDFNGTAADLKDYTTASFNRGNVLIGSASAGKNAAIGLAMGAMASVPVQRKISRVKNGALPISTGYFTDASESETYEAYWNAIHDKGYIFFRTIIGKSGVFFSSDRTATSTADDYAYFSSGFVIDKAMVLAYQTYANEIDDEIELTTDGKIQPYAAKELERLVESAISLQMIANGEIIDVKALVDINQNLLSTDKIELTLKILRVGYKSYLNVKLGFTNPASN